MLTPDYLQEVTNRVAHVVGGLRDSIIEKVCDAIVTRLTRGDEYRLTAKDAHLLNTLQKAGVLRADIISEIEKRTPLIRDEIEKAFIDAGVKSWKMDSLVFLTAEDKVLKQLDAHTKRWLEAEATKTADTFLNMTKTTADETQRFFIRECDKALTQVNSGGISLSEAVREATNNAVKSAGTITYTKIDENGKKHVHTDAIDVAVRRAVRTGVAQTTGLITMQRMAEYKWDLVLVSAHIGARDKGVGAENHAEWQGKIYSIDWSKVDSSIFKTLKKRDARKLQKQKPNKDFPDFITSTGYGTGEGLCGWNCRHSFAPSDGIHNPYETTNKIDDTENHKRYEAEQTARAMERAIRAQKRALIGLKSIKDQSDEDKVRYDKAKSKLAEMNKRYYEFCEDNKLKPFLERLELPKNE